MSTPHEEGVTPLDSAEAMPEGAPQPREEAAPSSSVEPAPAVAPARRARRLRLTIAAVTAAVVLASGVYTIAALPPSYAAGPAADFSDPDFQAPWMPTDVPDSQSYPAAWASMNEALRAKDRERFLAYAEGPAHDALSLWWDNTTAIGWETAYILPTTGSTAGKAGALLGSELAFSSRPLRGSGSDDAGYRLTQAFGYDITTEGDGDDLRITSFVPWSPMPWDEGRIHVVTREHVVLYGMSDEAALVDANADTAEKAAKLAIETITGLGGKVPMVGFVSGITDDDERMHRWQFGDGEGWDMEVAGYAQPTTRPAARSDFFESDVAVGDRTSGVLLMMGPASADERLDTFTHEFAHALHYAAAPIGLTDEPPAAVYEGFATYVELKTGLYSREVLGYPEVKDFIRKEGAAGFSDEALRAEDASLAYLAAGSYFLFLADSGGDPWKLALDGVDGAGKDLMGVAGDPRFSEAAWKQWAARQ